MQPPYFPAALVAEVSSGPSVGLALVAEGAVEKFYDLLVGLYKLWMQLHPELEI
jgi:hypothetical protein